MKHAQHINVVWLLNVENQVRMTVQPPESKPLQQARVARRADRGATGDPAQGGFKLVEQLKRRNISALMQQKRDRSVQIPVGFRTDTNRRHARLRPSALRLRAQ